MIVSFTFNGKKYTNFDFSNQNVVEKFKNLGVDVESVVKSQQKKNISEYTDNYVKQKLRKIDEDLQDIATEQSYLEGVFYSQGIDPSAIKAEVTKVVLGQEDINTAITNLSIPKDFVEDFNRAVEIAKIINWKEQVWKKEADLESQIDSMTFDDLLNLDVKKLCEDAYAQIELNL